MKKKHRKSTGGLEEQTSELPQVRAEVDEERVAGAAAVKKADTRLEGLTTAEAELDRTRQLNVRLAAELKDARGQVEDFRNRALTISGQLQVSQGEFTRLQENARMTEAQLTLLANRVAYLQAVEGDFARLQESTRMTEAQLEMTEAQLELMNKEVTRLGAERDSERAARTASEAREQSLQREIDAARAQLQALAAARAASELKIEELSRYTHELTKILTVAIEYDVTDALEIGSAGTHDGDGRIRSLAGRAGCIFFGPYLELLPGRYEAVFEFRSVQGLATRLVGLTVDVADDGKVIASRDVSTWRRNIVTTVPFEVFSEMSPRRIETRAHSQGTAQVTLLQCRIKAAD